MNPNTYETASEACEEVNQQIACASEGPFNKRPYLEKHIHIEANMDDAEVKKTAGEQTPPLMCAYGERAEVPTPVLDVKGCGLGEGDAACHHGGKDQNIDRDQGVGDRVGTGGAGKAFGNGGVIHVSTVL